MASEKHRERIRRSFVDAAKQIVVGEGIEAATARHVAEVAGFSYATIYNYFEDIDQLLWHVVGSCIRDVVTLLEPRLAARPYSISTVCAVYDDYVGYFLGAPNVLELIVTHRLKAPPPGFANLSGTPELAMMLLTELDDPECRKIPADELPLLARIITSSIHGMLSLYLSGKTERGASQLREDVAQLLSYLLKGKL